jgi:hypothetical protein
MLTNQRSATVCRVADRRFVSIAATTSARAQRVAVVNREVRIIGAKSNLLQTLTAAAEAKLTTPGICSSVLRWRATTDDDEHYVYAIALR